MIRWLKKKPAIKTDVESAKQALKETQGKTKAVDDLVAEVRARQAQNHFAPSLEAALGYRRQ